MKSGKIIIIITALAILLRLIFVWQFVNINNINQWEYGEIAKNIINNNGYSLFYFEEDSLEYRYKENITPFPSAYMPPGFVFIILPFFFLNDDFLINFFVILFQIICSVIVITVLFRLSEKLFGSLAALISIAIYAILPEFIYAVVSFSPTIVFHLAVLLTINRLLFFQEKSGFDVLVPLLLSFLIYLRSELVLFVFLILLILTIKKQFKFAFGSLLLILLFVLPWSLRNSVELSNIVPFTTNFGQNLYRGNNASDVGWWGEEIMAEKIKELPRNNSFEIYLNQLYLERAINYIKENPLRFVQNGIQKQFELWVFNLSDSRARSLIYMIPAISILILFIIGIIKTFNVSKLKFIYLFFLHAAFVASIFFAIPRYQTMMKVLMIPFASIGIIFFFDSIKQLIVHKKH